MATVVEAVTQGARVECCPEAITRPCESASDTACLLELAPRKRPSSSKANSAAALDWSPKMEKVRPGSEEKGREEKRIESEQSRIKMILYAGCSTNN